ncbi:MAG: CerR family C-terminal domain-containing protein [Planctomycetaceae bacterium]
MTDDTPTRVLHAAGPIFAEKGYESATIREICAAAGVNLASVNYHFGDKQALYLETVKLAHRLRLQQVPPPRWSPDSTPESRLRQFIKVMLTRMLGTHELGWQTQLMMREMLQPTGACRSIIEEFIRPELNRLLGVLDDLLPQDVGEEQRLQIAFSIVGQCLHYRVAGEFVAMLVPEHVRESHYQIDQLAEHISNFSLAAIRSLKATEPTNSNDS